MTRWYEGVRLGRLSTNQWAAMWWALGETVNVVTHLQTLMGLNERAGEALPSDCRWAQCQVGSHGETNWCSPPDRASEFSHATDRRVRNFFFYPWMTKLYACLHTTNFSRLTSACCWKCTVCALLKYQMNLWVQVWVFWLISDLLPLYNHW